jgi:hypothetical protein
MSAPRPSAKGAPRPSAATKRPGTCETLSVSPESEDHVFYFTQQARMRNGVCLMQKSYRCQS